MWSDRARARAGLAGADTDHSSVCFAVDAESGLLGEGVSANHWYRLGPRALGRLQPDGQRVWRSHPDTGAPVAGAAAHPARARACMCAHARTRSQAACPAPYVCACVVLGLAGALVIPNMREVLAAVVQAHVVAAPHLPLIGWDVAITPGAGRATRASRAAQCCMPAAAAPHADAR